MHVETNLRVLHKVEGHIANPSLPYSLASPFVFPFTVYSRLMAISDSEPKIFLITDDRRTVLLLFDH